MGPKPNKKGNKNARPTLPNPFLEETAKPRVEEIQSIVSLLEKRLCNLYPPQVSTKQVLDVINDEPHFQNISTNFKKMNKNDKREIIRKKRKEMRHLDDSKLNILLRNDIIIGLKKCLKEMSNNTLCALIFDSTVNLEPMRCIFQKGGSNAPYIIGIPKLGETLKKPLGFPAICIGFNRDVIKPQNDARSEHHFYPIIQQIQSFINSDVKVSKSICEIVSKGRDNEIKCQKRDSLCEDSQTTIDMNEHVRSPTERIERIIGTVFTQLPKIEMLYRSDDSSRIFIPQVNVVDESTNHAIEDNDFLSLSKSPDAKRKKMS